MSAGFQNVHVRVNDAATGKPTPVRIRFVGPDGTYYAPFGRLTEFCMRPGRDVGGNVWLGDKKFAYIDGSCEIRLPTGEVEVEIHKGPEYVPVHEKVPLRQGKLALRFEVRRWIDTRTLGWFSGDTHCVCLTPHAALLEGAAEDLAAVNLLIFLGEESDTPPGYPITNPHLILPAIANIDAFSGQRPCLEVAGHMVVVNTMNYTSLLGRLALLNTHRVVYPLRFATLPESQLEWTLADLCEQCHRKGGLAIALNYFFRNSGELLADIVLGHVDAIACPSGALENPLSLDPWFDLLSAGLTIPLAAGTGKNSNGSLLGRLRTYAWLGPGQDFTYKNWIEAVRAGRTFVSNGAVLFFAVDDLGPGARLQVATGKTRSVRATARSLRAFNSVECYFNGKLIGAAGASKADTITEANLELEFVVTEPGWFHACCRGPGEDGKPEIRAITSPIYVTLSDRPNHANRAAVETLLQRLAQQSAWVSTSEHFPDEHQRQRMQHVYDEAKERLLGKLKSE